MTIRGTSWKDQYYQEAERVRLLREELRIGNHLNAVQTDKINDLEAERDYRPRMDAYEALKNDLDTARARIKELLDANAFIVAEVHQLQAQLATRHLDEMTAEARKTAREIFQEKLLPLSRKKLADELV